MEMLRVYSGWTFDVVVGHGEEFSSSAYYPPPAGADEVGTTTHWFMMLVASLQCKDVQWTFQPPIYSVKDGTKPEDLRIEVARGHRRSILIPTYVYFIVPVLRYSPEVCAENMGVEARSLFTTGAYPWKLRRSDQDVRHPGDYQLRIITIKKAAEDGYSREQIQYETERDELRCDGDDWPKSES